ncbi:DUF1318 domain-containing protein [Leptospira ognonensis]|uniref:DUF1318 domain-containing protein n=1 Tax=Leptospira ognonensis TaxID=2484945 RepID=A0A4R9K517_9LEPT|nr:DUF1318 domain-containing protein [Leptospira ognonensis]TGL61262.1 DUF1318 domain-containing protein [Leptospira ognonensis]
MKLFSVIFIPLLLTHCQALINFKVPPFTITNAQTAAEKQMIGEDRDLEKDGWLVSSIQSSSGSNSSKSVSPSGGEDPEFSGHLMRLNYLAPEVKKYKTHGMIGEGYGGVLKNNPLASASPFFGQYDLPSKRKRIDDVLNLINESRKIIIEKQVDAERKKGKKEDELKIFKQSLVDGYQKFVTKGEYFEANAGKWERL